MIKETLACPFMSDSLSPPIYESQKTIFNDNVIRLFLHKCGFL